MPSLPPLLLFSSASFALAACNGNVTRVECTEMLDRYIDMTISADPSVSDLPSGDARGARDMQKALRRGDPRYVRVQDQCESQISRREYRCAMKAPTPETWQACID